MIIMSLIVLYGFYLLIDLAWVGVAWLGANKIARHRLLKFIYLLPVMPLYRMVVYWFRLGGFLHAVAEPGVWSVQDPFDQVLQGLSQVMQGTSQIFNKIPLPQSLAHFRSMARGSGDVNKTPVEDHIVNVASPYGHEERG
jgi:hypothetical protein